MSEAWVTVVAIGAGTLALKALGPIALGGRSLPRRLTGVIELLAPALLSALVAVQAFTDDGSLVLDERVIGLAVAGIALWRKAPVLVVVVAAAAATAIVRLLF